MHKRQSPETVESLTDHPPNILTDILARLPLKSLFSSRCVCKTFLNLTTTPNPHFTRLHSSYAAQALLLQFGDVDKPSIRLRLIDPELDLAVGNFRSRPIFQMPKLRSPNTLHFRSNFREENKLVLTNSCNGLIYLVRRHASDERSIVCNPVTNEYVVIPGANRQSGLGSGTRSMWLGFSPGSSQYKVLRKFSSGNDEYVSAQVLVVGSDSWRDIEARPVLGRYHSWDACSIFLNGLIYWLDVFLKDISFFDFEREMFGGISLPSEFGEEGLPLSKIRGCLCVSYYDFKAQHVELWVMEKHGDEGSWRKEFVIEMVGPMERPIRGYFKPLQLLRNGEILMLWIRNDLVCYDPRTTSVRFLRFGWLRLKLKAVAFTPSFISLKDTLLVDKVIVQSVRPRGNESEL